MFACFRTGVSRDFTILREDEHAMYITATNDESA